MQGQPLLSPKMRRQESANNGRRAVQTGAVVGLTLAALFLAYMFSMGSFSNSIAPTADIQPASQSRKVGSFGAETTEEAESVEDEPVLPRLKPADVSSSRSKTAALSSSSAAEEQLSLEKQSEASADEKATLDLELTVERDATTDVVTQEQESKQEKQMEEGSQASEEPASGAEKESEDESSAESDSDSGSNTEESGESSSSPPQEEEAEQTSEPKDEDSESQEEESKKSKKSKKGKKEKKEKKEKKSKKRSSGDESTDDQQIDAFPVCDPELSEVIPCLDHNIHKKMKLHLKTGLMEHYERHCPPSDLRVRCLVPPPADYKTPIRWPESRDVVWKSNVPHPFLATEKSDQHWMVVDGDKIRFPGGGTHFHDGADKYIQSVGRMLKNEDGDLSLGGKIRTVLDIGCGVASFGAFLLDQGMIAMSVAPNDRHENQIQFALERGVPAWLGVLGTKRLPFPSAGFDLAHCSRCRIDWGQRDGVLLLELDRLLRPGGYWVWSAPPAYRDDEESRALWKQVADVASRLCWTLEVREAQTAIFRKPKGGSCYGERPEGTVPALCDDQGREEASSTYNVSLSTCIAAPSTDSAVSVAPWPRRLKAPPPRVALTDVDTDAYKKMNKVWAERVDAYWALLADRVQPDSVRNVLDMNAGLGSFAAALTAAKPVWVMTAVPPTDAHALEVIYDRGLLGVYHDWCEEFSTYPRTYDLLHAHKVLSLVTSRHCSSDDLLLEMDRIMRPGGFLLLRDSPALLARVVARAPALRWTVLEGPLSPAADGLPGEVEGETGKEEVMVVMKNLVSSER
ncbi:hypothetical protein CLOM_g14435 [Closterium sp. NIES-68]|nr:hypothetical protein CLOM_g14435 [Closterium sp. NIES-68]GJP60706.1 hypothetical protein CLOP_g17918 [Closterium sp. NIES-67]